MSHDHHIHISNTDLITDEGTEMGSIGDEGIDAGESDVFDPDADMDSKLDSFDQEFGDADSTDGGSSWFDGGGFDGDSSDVSSCSSYSSCSSCSSCASCGGD